MKRKTLFLFSGQGSQYFQMGRELYEQNATFRACLEEMDRQVRDILGISVVQTVYGRSGKELPFDDIRLTHPAIFMVEYALARTVIEMGVRPDYVLGASLGIFAALSVADCLPVEAALEQVTRQGMLIAAHCPKGGMIAVMAAPDVYRDSPFLQARSMMAGQNFATHFVLSVPEDNLSAVEHFLARRDITYQRLSVHYPFHSAWIDPLRDVLIGHCRADRLRLSATPVVCCAQQGVLREISPDHFWNVARKEVAFMRTITAMEWSGPFDYLDCGPAGSLSTFLKYLLPPHSASRRFSCMTPFGRDSGTLASVVMQLRETQPIDMAEV